MDALYPIAMGHDVGTHCHGWPVLFGALKAASRAGCVAALLLLASPVRAQQVLDQFISPTVGGAGVEPGVTVLSRQRPELAPLGVRVGSFLIRPSLVESAGYETNVLGLSKARGSSTVLTSGAVEAQSDVSRVDLNGLVTVDDTRYLALPKQSYTNFSARLAGRYDVGRDAILVQYRHDRLNQTARDLDVPQGLDRALPFDIDTARIGYQKTFNRLVVTPAVEVGYYAYENGTTGGQPYNQDYRNRIVVTPGVTVAYELAPRRNLVAVVRDSIASYTRNFFGVPKRDFNDVSVLGGIDYDATAVIRIRALAGYEYRSFTSSQAYKTISGPVIELSTIWTPTGLTTVTGTVGRRIQDSANETTAAVTETTARFQVDHEYLRNILLRGTAGVILDEYQSGAGTNQTLYTAGASATYSLNRNMAVSASYDLIVRSSAAGGNLGLNGQFFGSNYTDHRALLQLRLRL